MSKKIINDDSKCNKFGENCNLPKPLTGQEPCSKDDHDLDDEMYPEEYECTCQINTSVHGVAWRCGSL